jgi:hypothetical protein
MNRYENSDEDGREEKYSPLITIRDVCLATE